MTRVNNFVAAPATTRRGANKTHFVIAGAVLALLLAVGCSKEKSKPVADSSVLNNPSQTITPPSAPVLSAAQPAVQKPVAKKAVRKHASMVTYKDDSYGLSFGYPRKYTLKTGEDLKSESDAVAMNFVQTGGEPAVSVELPNNAYPGTDLNSAFFRVNVLKGLGENECNQFALPQTKSDDKNAVQPSEVEIGGMKLREVENISGESVKQADTKYYHLFEGGSCYEFALGLTTAWDGNEDGVNLVDREDVFRRLEKILVGVKINEVKSETPVVAAGESKASDVAESKPGADASGGSTQPASQPGNSATSSQTPTQATTSPQPEIVK